MISLLTTAISQFPIFMLSGTLITYMMFKIIDMLYIKTSIVYNNIATEMSIAFALTFFVFIAVLFMMLTWKFLLYIIIGVFLIRLLRYLAPSFGKIR